MEAQAQAQATQVSDAVGSTSTGIDPSVEVGSSEQLEEGGGTKPLQEDIQANDSVAKEGEELQNKSDDLDWGLVFTFFKFRDE
jgi:hypothetical protein